MESAVFGNTRSAGVNAYRDDEEGDEQRNLYDMGQDIPHDAIRRVHLRVDMPGSWDSMYNALSTTIRCRDALRKYNVEVDLTIHKFAEAPIRTGTRVDFHGLVTGRMADHAYETVVLDLQECGSLYADTRSAEEVLLAWSPPKVVNIVIHPETMMGPLSLIYVINDTIRLTSEHVNDFMGVTESERVAGDRQYWPTLNYGQQMLVRPSVDVSMLLFTEFVNLSHWMLWGATSWFLECLPAKITPRAYNGVEGNGLVTRWGPFRFKDREDPEGKTLDSEAISPEEAIASALSAELWSSMKRLQKKIGKEAKTSDKDELELIKKVAGDKRLERLTTELKQTRAELVIELKRHRKSHFGKRCNEYKQGHYHGGMVEGCKYSPFVHLEVTMATRGRRRTVSQHGRSAALDADLLAPRKSLPDTKDTKEEATPTPSQPHPVAGNPEEATNPTAVRRDGSGGSGGGGGVGKVEEEGDDEEEDEEEEGEEMQGEEHREDMVWSGETYSKRVRYEVRPYAVTRMRDPDSPMTKLVNETDMWIMNTVSWRKRTLLFVAVVIAAMVSVMYFVSSAVVWSTQPGSFKSVIGAAREIGSFKDFMRVLLILSIPMTFFGTYIGMTLNVLLYHFEIRLLPRSSGARGVRTRASVFFSTWLKPGQEILLLISYFVFPLFGAILTVFAFFYRKWGRVVTLVLGVISMAIVCWTAHTTVAVVLCVLIALSCQRVWTWTKNQIRKRVHNMVGFLRKRRAQAAAAVSVFTAKRRPKSSR